MILFWKGRSGGGGRTPMKASNCADLEKSCLADITDRFSLSVIDHQELLVLLTLRYATCWRKSDNEISFPASDDYRLNLEMHHGQITKVSSGTSLSEPELVELLNQVETDLKDETIDEYGFEILFASKPVKGGYRLKTLPIQISPAPPEAPRPPFLKADHPFVLEYPIKRCRTPNIRFLRRRKNAIEWAWVLNALLRSSIKYFSSRPRSLWATKSMECGPLFWAQENYTITGFEAVRSQLSQQRARLPVVPAAAYYGSTTLRTNLPLDEFYLPDDIDSVIVAFTKLSNDRRRRFLRSAAAIYAATEFWTSSMSGYFLACVQAIETLVDRLPAEPCPTCGKDMSPGPTRLFREFVEKYCRLEDVDEKIVKNLYAVRSALAHGKYLFQLDEAPWAFSMAASVASHHELEMSWAALSMAKDGLRNWLLS